MFKRIVDKIIDNEVAKRKLEIEERLRIEENKLKISYAEKLAELNALNDKLNNQIKEVERTRQNAEAEQKRLWERLDILRDNLNTEQVWMKLWESAFSKAVDVIWGIFKKETLHLIDLAKIDTYAEVEKKLSTQFDKKLGDIIAKSIDIVNVPLLLKLKEEAHKQYLIFEKVKDATQMQFYLGQLKLIEEVLNEKKV